MSSITPSGYRFGATYVGTKQYSPGEAYPVLVGDIDPLGNMNANIYHRFTENLIARFQAQVSHLRTKKFFIGSNLPIELRMSVAICSPTL